MQLPALMKLGGAGRHKLQLKSIILTNTPKLLLPYYYPLPILAVSKLFLLSVAYEVSYPVWGVRDAARL